MAVQPLSPATDRRLGEPLPHQLANQTRAHLSAIKSLITKSCGFVMLCGIISRFQLLSPSERQIAHVLLTRPPLARGASTFRSFDLHVLSVPPAFVLSQDQTLNLSCILTSVSTRYDLSYTRFPTNHCRACLLLYRPGHLGLSPSSFSPKGLN